MGRYAREARFHAEQIQHYYDHAGGMGYSQARYHQCQLSNLIGRAFKSKNDKNDVVTIQSLKETADRQMDEMQQREAEMIKMREEREAQS